MRSEFAVAYSPRWRCPPSRLPSRRGRTPATSSSQGQALTRQGKIDDALDLYRHALQLTPDSFPANSAAGVAAD